MPWKNGGGTTLQLYVDQAPPDYNLRLSVASVAQDGPFSVFSGYERTLLILKGQGCVLHSDHQAIELTPESPPQVFQGEEIIHCTLKAGEIYDFNVMIKRNWGKAQTRRASNETYRNRSNSSYVYEIDNEFLIQLEEGEEYVITSPSIIVEITSR